MLSTDWNTVILSMLIYAIDTIQKNNRKNVTGCLVDINVFVVWPYIVVVNDCNSIKTYIQMVKFIHLNMYYKATKTDT